MKLKVPYKSQWGVGANESRDDCGPACVSMLLAAYGIDKSVDEVFRATGASPNSLTTFDKLGIASRKYGLNVEHHIFSLDTLKQKIKEGFPAVALVNYRHFPKKQDKYNGPHFVVAFGQTANTIICHDPNRLRGKVYGDTVTIKNEPWRKMWQSTNQEHGNKNCQVLIPTGSLEGGEEIEMNRRDTIVSIYRALYHRDPTKQELDRWDASQKNTSVTVAELFASLELENKLSALTTHASDTERAVNKLTTTLNTKIDNLAVDNSQLRSELEADRKVASETSSKVDTMGETVKELQEGVTTLTGQLGNLGERLAEIEKKLPKLLENPAPSASSDKTVGGEGVRKNEHGILWDWFSSISGWFSRGR